MAMTVFPPVQPDPFPPRHAVRTAAARLVGLDRPDAAKQLAIAAGTEGVARVVNQIIVKRT